jgi:hypothetical protein
MRDRDYAFDAKHGFVGEVCHITGDCPVGDRFFKVVGIDQRRAREVQKAQALLAFAKDLGVYHALSVSVI